MKRAAVLGLALVLTSLGAPAAAEPSPARVAYDRATAEFEAKSYAAAAADFALADQLSPNPVALESALKAVLLADDPALGMELAERASGRPATPALSELVGRAREAFAKRAGQLRVRCAVDKVCTATLVAKDAAGAEQRTPLEIEGTRWVRAGTQLLETTFEGSYARHQVDVMPGSTLTFEVPPVVEKPKPPPPPEEAPPPPKRPHARAGDRYKGAHPAFFGVALGLTAAAGAVTIWSGVRTLNLHAEWYDYGDDAVREDGQAAQLRTNILFGVLGGGAVSTTLLGIFTDWDGKPASGVAIHLAPTGAGLEVSF